MNEALFEDVQGWVLRGYKMKRVRHCVLHVRDADRAKRWIGRTVSGDDPGVPQVQTALDWGATKPTTMFNLAFTATGLEALGVDVKAAGFPGAFIEGMTARHVKIADLGPSDPTCWIEPYRDPAELHIVATIHGDDDDELAAIAAMIPGDAFETVIIHDGAALPGYDGNEVYFGYRDNISQPRIEEVNPEHKGWDCQPFAPLGVSLLGYPNAMEGLRWKVPALPGQREADDPDQYFGHNGAFNAFRILRQEVDEFDAYLETAKDTLLEQYGDEVDVLFPDGWEDHWPEGTTKDDALVEIVAAKFLGRWRSGNSLATDPIGPGRELRPPEELSRFDYADDYDGQRCPIGSHVRRNNPRQATIVQRYANHTRRITRRGMPYDQDGEKGLLGNFMCASLSAQFEALQNDWMNVGLLDPRVNATNDPVLGANEEKFSRFTFPVGDSLVSLRGFQRFVNTRGGLYTFIPSITALGQLAR